VSCQGKGSGLVRFFDYKKPLVDLTPQVMLAVVVLAALSLVSSASALTTRFDPNLHIARLIVRQTTSIPSQCDSVCTPLGNDVEPCVNDSSDQLLADCVCTTQGQADFLQCAQCDTELQQQLGLSASGIASSLSEICASLADGGSTTPSSNSTSTSTGGGCDTACAPALNDIEECDSNQTDACLCSTNILNDYLPCAQCNSTFYTALGATSAQQGLSDLQEACASTTSTASEPAETTPIFGSVISTAPATSPSTGTSGGSTLPLSSSKTGAATKAAPVGTSLALLFVTWLCLCLA